MKRYTKTLLGSAIAFFIGTSCCWLSAVAIWLGGATFIGAIVKWVENFQLQLLLIGVFFALLTLFLYQQSRKK